MTCTVFTKDHLINARRRGKYIPVLTSLLHQPDGVIDIHPKYHGLYAGPVISTRSITNKSEILQFVGGVVEPTMTWPTISSNAGNVALYHLQKTGQFNPPKDHDVTDTDIKEALVGACFIALTAGDIAIDCTVTKNNIAIISYILQCAVDQISDTPDCIAKAKKWLQDQATIQTTTGAQVIQMSLSQALAIFSAYPTGTIDRNTIYRKVRAVARDAALMWADKWNPGDVYIVNNAHAPMLSCLDLLPGHSPPITEINNLFADVWGCTNKPLVSISLKLSEAAQAGKCKGLVRTFGDDPSRYHMTTEENKLPIHVLSERINAFRENLMLLPDPYEYSGPKKWDHTVAGDQRTREKYAVLKLSAYLISVSSNSVATIQRMIAFAMALSGCNPTFFKIAGTRTGSAQVDTYKRESTIRIISPKITIVESNTTNATIIRCDIKKHNKKYHIQLAVRTNGYTHPTIELYRVTEYA